MKPLLRLLLRRWAVAWRQLSVLTLKELRQLVRDRPLLLFVCYIFTFNILLAGESGSRELNRASLLVHDADRTADSRELISRFQPPYFRFAGEVQRPEEGMRALDSGTAVLFLDIPEQFSADLHRPGHATRVQLLINASKATRGYLAASYGSRIVAAYGQEWAAKNLRAVIGGSGSLPGITTQTRVWYNAELNETWFHAISELLTIMTAACILLPASAMVREKERGTIDQLLVSPLTPFQVLFPKVLSMMLVMLVGTAVSLFGIMQPVFHIPFRGSIPLFFALIALYVATNAGLGLLIASFARTAAQAGMLVLLLVMPIIVLSGTWTPVESMPASLRAAMTLSPLRHFVEIGYGIILRGDGLDDVKGPVLAMTLLGSGIFAAGAWRFRRQFR